jgi:hypothetical protein
VVGQPAHTEQEHHHHHHTDSLHNALYTSKDKVLRKMKFFTDDPPMLSQGLIDKETFKIVGFIRE